jgi:dipeptidase E
MARRRDRVEASAHPAPTEHTVAAVVGLSERHIVALGGGGFSDGDPSLDDFILGLARSPRPRVCFVATASGDSESYLVRFYETFTWRDCVPMHLSLFGRPEPGEVGARIAMSDIVYVGGGNTANMLAVWRLHRVDAALREAWERGAILCGTSAGANCWFEACTTDSFGPIGPLNDGLAFLAGSFCPHYDAEPDRRPTYLRLVTEGFPAGYAAEDEVALHFSGTELAEAVASRDGARAFRVERRDSEAVETPLPVRLL